MNEPSNDHKKRPAPEETAVRRLHHDLRSSLSAVAMDLQTLDALESVDRRTEPMDRLKIVRRAQLSVRQAADLLERLGALEDERERLPQAMPPPSLPPIRPT